MRDMLVVDPDIDLIRKVKTANPSFKNCMQCGNCSVVCSLSPEDRPFPRKEMIYASWGLSDKLLGNANIWQCYQCGDCTQYCPRGVRPSDILSAIREYNYMYYARPRLMVKILSKPALLPVAVLIPAIIISLIIYAAGTFRIPEGPVDYSLFFPHSWLNITFTAITLMMVVITMSGIKKFWNNLRKHFPSPQKTTGIFKSILKVRKEIVLHSSFGECEAQSTRKIAHLLVFYGFILLLGVTVYAIYAALTHRYPLALTNPAKLTGNLAAIMLFTGTGIMIYNRLANKTAYGKSSYSDWLLLISLFLLTLSGVIVEMARFLNWTSAYFIYFLHLILVWFIIIYTPYTKFGHFIYRIAALVFIQSRTEKSN
jgi:quinone-modifying oxidoreductase subunit QmoC